MRRQLVLLALLPALVACNPELLGECRSDSDCPTGTRCGAGLCLADDTTDGGTPGDDAGSNDGGSVDGGSVDEGNDDGGASDAGEVFVTIDAPTIETVFGEEAIAITISAGAPGAISQVSVRLQNTPLTAVATEAAPGQYTATLDLENTTVASGRYPLIATLTHDGGTRESAPVAVHVDRTGPAITFATIVYPTRTPSHPATNAFLRSETVVVEATVVDTPAGLGSNVPTLTALGLPAVTGVPVGGDRWRFSFAARTPAFPQLAGELPIRISALDAKNNTSSADSGVQLSRVKWRWTNPRTQPVSAAPAIAGDLVVLGSSDQFVYALNRADATLAWDHDVGSPVVGHVTASPTTTATPNIYVATSEGRIYGLDGRASALPDATRRLFRCPDTDLGDGAPRALVTGPSLGNTRISRDDDVDEETLFALTADGRLRMYRRSPFPISRNFTHGCLRELDFDSSNVASVPALAFDNGILTAFVADEDGVVHKVAVNRNTTNGVVSLSQVWEHDTGRDVLAPVSITTSGAKLAVVATRDDGSIRALDFAKTLLFSSGNVVNGDVRTSSAFVDGFGFIVDEDGKAQKYTAAANPQKQWTPPFSGAPQDSGANAGPLVAGDGRVYVATGPQLNVLAADGTLEWRLDTRPGGSGTATILVDTRSSTLACDGTLYVPANSATQGFLYALETDSTTGLGRSSWPKTFHDARNTSNFATPLPTAGTCAD